MAARVNRGEVWRLHLPYPDKRRPVVVISRPSLIRCCSRSLGSSAESVGRIEVLLKEVCGWG